MFVATLFLVTVVAATALLSPSHALPMQPQATMTKAEVHASVLVDKLMAILGKDFTREEIGKMPLDLALRLLEGPSTPQEKEEHALAQQLLEPTNLFVPIGFTAVGVCSCVFVSGIDEQTCITEDGSGAARPCDVVVDYANQWVEATIRGSSPPQTYRAIFRGPTLGCTLVGGGITEAEIRAQDTGLQTPIEPLNATEPWPLGEGPAVQDPTVDYECIQRVTDEDFSNQFYNTRATVLVYNGNLVYERYAPGITANSALLGWSMTKSVMSALFGMVVADGLLDLDARADVPEWPPLQNITHRAMLQMESGILWTESYHLVLCLYEAVDCARYYAELPSIRDPNTVFTYSTGLSMLLSRIVEEKRGQREINTFDWHRERLFRPLGLSSAVMEFLAAGYMSGGSQTYMKPRDWARFGFLYLNNGNWFGQQLVDPEWVRFSCTDSPSSDGSYAAQWWRTPQGIDEDICTCSGFRKQNIFVLPNRGIVAVRNAMPQLSIGWAWRDQEWLSGIASCFPQQQKKQ